jgi:beta-lactamase regulating signal transducer with metallopeptidase domain/Tol biopolymer transport system component
METLSTYAQPFFSWLLRTTIQASVVICLILLIQAAFRKRFTARWQYALWLILVVRMILPWAPQSRISIYNYATWQRKSNLPASIPVKRDAEPTKTPGGSSIAPQTTAGSGPAGATEGQDRSLPVPTGTSRISADSATNTMFRLSAVLPFLWLTGALALGGYIIICNLRLWRAASVECPSTDKETLEQLEECRATIGLRTIVALVPSKTINTPVLLGFVRPRLLIPKDITKHLSHEELRYIFLHELAHVKHNDIALAWLTTILQVLHWFNPLVWLAFHRMRSDRELACDALVLTKTQGDSPKDYGRAIVSLMERLSFPPRLPGLAGILENKSQLKRRIQMITKFKNNSYRWSPLAVILIIAIGCMSIPDASSRKAAETSAIASYESQRQSHVTMHRMQMDSDAVYGSTSPDGRYLCGWDAWRVREEIVIREVATGEERTIKPTKETPEDGYPQDPIMSPDNKTIAYYVERPQNEVNDVFISTNVCLIGADGSGKRVLYRSGAPRPALIPVQWFPDCRHLLALGWSTPKDLDMVSISVEDSSVQVIKKLTCSLWNTTVRLSPDGKYVAYELPSKADPAKNDIFAIEISSQRETLLVGHAADDRLLDWTPDGRYILFISDRLGQWSTWLLPVAQGNAQDTPKLVSLGTGSMRPIGFAQNGSYIYRIRAVAADIYTAGIDSTTGQLLSAPVPLRTVGFNETVDWSPDGKYLAYSSMPVTVTQSTRGVIRIRSLATGEERELANKLPPFDCLRWSRDGHWLLVSGLRAYKPEDMPFTGRVYRIDATTGESTVLLNNKVDNWVMMAELSPDGKTLYYWQAGIIRRDISSGQEKTIFPCLYKGTWVSWALSPNGEFIVTGSNEGTGQKGPEGGPDGGVKKVLLIPSQGGQVTELVRWDQELSSYLTDTRWSPDGKTVLFMLHKVSFVGKNMKGINELWQVSIDGGEPRKIMETDLGMLGRRGFRVRPDGQQIAFPAGVGGDEVWMMENFLPDDSNVNESK